MMCSGSCGGTFGAVISPAGHLFERIRGLDPVRVDYVVAVVVLIGFELNALTAVGEHARWAVVVLGSSIAAAATTVVAARILLRMSELSCCGPHEPVIDWLAKPCCDRRPCRRPQ